MSSINNIPFDINRTAVERNSPAKPGGTVPVQHSEALHPTDKQVRITERRSGNSRRHHHKAVKLNKRLLGERRDNTQSPQIKDGQTDKAHTSGSIIDLEV